jgi:hypothetical protein
MLVPDLDCKGAVFPSTTTGRGAYQRCNDEGVSLAPPVASSHSFCRLQCRRFRVQFSHNLQQLADPVHEPGAGASQAHRRRRVSAKLTANPSLSVHPDTSHFVASILVRYCVMTGVASCGAIALKLEHCGTAEIL